jgi:hypothetical protein
VTVVARSVHLPGQTVSPDDTSRPLCHLHSMGLAAELIAHSRRDLAGYKPRRLSTPWSAFPDSYLLAPKKAATISAASKHRTTLHRG